MGLGWEGVDGDGGRNRKEGRMLRECVWRVPEEREIKVLAGMKGDVIGLRWCTLGVGLGVSKQQSGGTLRSAVIHHDDAVSRCPPACQPCAR